MRREETRVVEWNILNRTVVNLVQSSESLFEASRVNISSILWIAVNWSAEKTMWVTNKNNHTNENTATTQIFDKWIALPSIERCITTWNYLQKCSYFLPIDLKEVDISGEQRWKIEPFRLNTICSSVLRTMTPTGTLNVAKRWQNA